MKINYKIKEFSNKIPKVGDWVITKTLQRDSEWGRQAYKVLDRSLTTVSLAHHTGTTLLKNVKKVGSSHPNVTYND